MINYYKNKNYLNTAKFPTFQNKKIGENIIKYTDQIYYTLDQPKKITTWSLIGGFETSINTGFTNQIHITKCPEFICEQVNKLKLVQVDKILHSNYIAGQYFGIVEHKIDTTTKLEYSKTRYVCDGTAFNNFILNPSEEFSYNFPTIKTLFTDLNIFKRIMNCNLASAYDKSEFYRSILVIPNEFSYVIDENGNIYVDLYATMGSKLSPCFSQLVANLLDVIFRHFHSNFCLSLQDDTIYLQMDNMLPKQAVTKFNSDFNFIIQDKKIQSNQKIISWSGFEINFSSKSVKVPEKKLEKINMLIIKLKIEQVSRRNLPQILGKFYAYSIISNAYALNFSSHTRNTRNLLFYNSAGLYKELQNLWFFVNTQVLNEVDFMNRVINLQASFRNIRQHIFSFNSSILNFNHTSHENFSVIFCDASSTSWGIHLKLKCNETENKFLEVDYAGNFSAEDLCLSINLKEYLALIFSVLLTSTLDKTKFVTDFLVFTDNTSVEMLAVSKKAKIKNRNLAKLAEILSNIQFCSQSNYSIFRVESQQNKHADYLSRNTRLFPSQLVLGLSLKDLFNHFLDPTNSPKYLHATKSDSLSKEENFSVQ